MDDLVAQCAEIYESLSQSTVQLTLEGGLVLEILFSTSGFKHLVGLHKLTDIRGVSDLPALKAFKKSRSGELWKKIRKSSRYRIIEDRIKYFPLIPSLLSGKVIVNFDVRMVAGGSELTNTDYILYRQMPNGVVHLTLTEGYDGYHPESFFFDPSKKYITGQTLLDIVAVKIVPR